MNNLNFTIKELIECSGCMINFGKLNNSKNEKCYLLKCGHNICSYCKNANANNLVCIICLKPHTKEVLENLACNYSVQEIASKFIHLSDNNLVREYNKYCMDCKIILSSNNHHNKYKSDHTIVDFSNKVNKLKEIKDTDNYNESNHNENEIKLDFLNNNNLISYNEEILSIESIIKSINEEAFLYVQSCKNEFIKVNKQVKTLILSDSNNTEKKFILPGILDLKEVEIVNKLKSAIKTLQLNENPILKVDDINTITQIFKNYYNLEYLFKQTNSMVRNYNLAKLVLNSVTSTDKLKENFKKETIENLVDSLLNTEIFKKIRSKTLGYNNWPVYIDKCNDQIVLLVPKLFITLEFHISKITTSLDNIDVPNIIFNSKLLANIDGIFCVPENSDKLYYLNYNTNDSSMKLTKLKDRNFVTSNNSLVFDGKYLFDFGIDINNKSVIQYCNFIENIWYTHSYSDMIFFTVPISFLSEESSIMVVDYVNNIYKLSYSKCKDSEKLNISIKKIKLFYDKCTNLDFKPSNQYFIINSKTIKNSDSDRKLCEEILLIDFLNKSIYKIFTSNGRVYSLINTSNLYSLIFSQIEGFSNFTKSNVCCNILYCTNNTDLVKEFKQSIEYSVKTHNDINNNYNDDDLNLNSFSGMLLIDENLISINESYLIDFISNDYKVVSFNVPLL
jgi:hypothetical protein